MTNATKLIELLRAASVKGGMCDVAADLIEQQAARIAQLETQCRAWEDAAKLAEKDAKRLDFVMTRGAIAHWSKDHEYCWLVRETEDDGQYATERMVKGCFDTPREAIDAAIAASAEKGDKA